ncbi:MAG: 4-alpha-glucanotransferase [Clostridiales bacterium]|nr:4-alpha-glucanotransferase [Clostridiales bacterium]
MRECGVLLPVASLPSKYGIGGFSREAYRFVDDLKAAGQKYWQILPMGPTGYGDSPYQSFSAFAGNPYFIDLEALAKEKLLTAQECAAADCTGEGRYVDYEAIYRTRFTALRLAYGRWKKQIVAKGESPRQQISQLSAETREYCFYAAVKRHFGEKSWEYWDDDIRLRRPEAVERYRQLLADEIGFYEFQQVMFAQQWKELKEYAHKQGIRVIGDIPIYVAYDSADSWSHPELFQFNADGRPSAVAGVPPDAFSADGQLWGNPLYRWDYHQKTGFSWWLKRMDYCFSLYDVVRVDHFRGFDEYYAVPAGEKTARLGRWEKGPGFALFEKMKERFGKLPIIAEDLGYLTPSVLELVKKTGFPGMKVLEFAFNANERSSYLPCFYEHNCVVYTGTHDNDTAHGWFASLSENDRHFAAAYMGKDAKGVLSEENAAWELIRLALASVADLAVIPLQDYLNLDSTARINIPSTLGGNWSWRMKEGEFTPELIRRCRELCEVYGR